MALAGQMTQSLKQVICRFLLSFLFVNSLRAYPVMQQNHLNLAPKDNFKSDNDSLCLWKDDLGNVYNLSLLSKSDGFWKVSQRETEQSLFQINMVFNFCSDFPKLNCENEGPVFLQSSEVEIFDLSEPLANEAMFLNEIIDESDQMISMQKESKNSIHKSKKKDLKKRKINQYEQEEEVMNEEQEEQIGKDSIDTFIPRILDQKLIADEILQIAGSHIPLSSEDLQEEEQISAIQKGIVKQEVLSNIEVEKEILDAQKKENDENKFSAYQQVIIGSEDSQVQTECHGFGKSERSLIELIDFYEVGTGLKIVYRGGEECFQSENSDDIGEERSITFLVYCSSEDESNFQSLPLDGISVTSCNPILSIKHSAGCYQGQIKFKKNQLPHPFLVFILILLLILFIGSIIIVTLFNWIERDLKGAMALPYFKEFKNWLTHPKESNVSEMPVDTQEATSTPQIDVPDAKTAIC